MMPTCQHRRCNEVADYIKVENFIEYAGCKRHTKWAMDRYYDAVKVNTEIGVREKALEPAIDDDDYGSIKRLRKQIVNLENYGTPHPSLWKRLTGGRI